MYLNQADWMFFFGGKSVLNGSEGHGCSMQHCGVYLMPKKEIEQYKCCAPTATEFIIGMRN